MCAASKAFEGLTTVALPQVRAAPENVVGIGLKGGDDNNEVDKEVVKEVGEEVSGTFVG